MHYIYCFSIHIIMINYLQQQLQNIVYFIDCEFYREYFFKFYQSCYDWLSLERITGM